MKQTDKSGTPTEGRGSRSVPELIGAWAAVGSAAVAVVAFMSQLPLARAERTRSAPSSTARAASPNPWMR